MSFQTLRRRLIPPHSRRETFLRALVKRLRMVHQSRVADSYQSWAFAHQKTNEELAEQRWKAESFSYKPRFSIVIPVYNPPSKVLAETIRSILAQSYSFWELCIADGGSSRAGIREVLEELSWSDRRIRVKYLNENLGISGNTNAALKLATGDFILFMDHDDLLAPEALFEIASYLQQNQADLIYFDEDKVDETGKKRRDPLFKPDWSPEMLLSANTLTHPVIRRSLLDKVGVFNSEFDGTQDWDLVLRISEVTDKIAHIPQILYHWRQIAGSTAGEFNAKAYVFERQTRAVREHLERAGIERPQAIFLRPGVLRVTWPLPEITISIIIPTKDNPTILRKCLSSLLEKTRYPAYEVLLVDNGSRDPATLDYYRELETDKRVRIILYERPFNYSTANNLGASHATGAYLLFLNNDIEVLDPDWLEELVRWAVYPGVGAVGPKLIYPDGSIQHAGVVVGLCGHADHIFAHAPDGYGGIFGSVDWYRNYLALTGACLMLSHHLFDEVGGFDEGYSLVYNDIDLCLRLIQAGYRNVYTPFARLIHHEGGTRGRSMPYADMQRAYTRFHELIIGGDPYYNPNLSYGSQIPLLRPSEEESRLERVERLMGAYR